MILEITRSKREHDALMVSQHAAPTPRSAWPEVTDALCRRRGPRERLTLVHW